MSGQRSVAAAVRGRAHEATGTPCQDVCAVGVGETRAWLALADGAGSCAQALHGARAVVACANAFLWRNRARLGRPEARQALWETLRQALADEAESRACAVKDLGSTFLTVQVWSGRFVAFHLGDGVIGCLRADGTLETVSAPENGDFCNQTWLTTSADAPAHLRMVEGPLGDIVAFFALSDGAAEALWRPEGGRFAPALRILADYLRDSGTSAARQLLRTFLSEDVRARTDDDASFALLLCPTARKDEKRIDPKAAKAMRKLIRFLQARGAPCLRKLLERHLHWEGADVWQAVFLPLMRSGALTHLGGQLYVAGAKADAFLKGRDHGE